MSKPQDLADGSELADAVASALLETDLKSGDTLVFLSRDGSLETHHVEETDDPSTVLE